MHLLKRSLIGACLATAAIGTALGAPFVPSICVQLEAQLINIQRGAGDPGSANYQQYDDALNRQKAELDRARSDASRMGCVASFGFFQQSRDPRCAGVLGTIDRMQANYERLRSRRDQFSYNPFQTNSARSQVLQALANNNCGPQYASFRSGFSSFFGFGAPPPSNNFDDPLAGGGTFRTLCVRTCDGYYFPISFSTVRGKFPSDQEACQAMCPNTDVALYVHHNPGEDSEAMVSATTGQPYNKLPTAFAYRTAYNPTCSCGSPSVALNAAPAPAGTGAKIAVLVPVPIAKPRFGEDPETVANAAGGFTPAPIAAKRVTVAGDVPGPADSGSREVRVVGPSYYFAQ